MRVFLRPHPNTPCESVSGLETEAVRRENGQLALSYVLTGAISRLYAPPRAQPRRTDELWRRTCFEAFVRSEGAAGYIELNLSPSTEWAAYRFTGYREGMAPAPIAAPRIDLSQAGGSLELAVQLNLAGLNLPTGACWLALSAVIEETTGGKSYWALAHPPGRPDFHHRSSFACELPLGDPAA